MDNVRNGLMELCLAFINLLDDLLEEGLISKGEYNIYGKTKKQFIEKTKSKLPK